MLRKSQDDGQVMNEWHFPITKDRLHGSGLRGLADRHEAAVGRPHRTAKNDAPQILQGPIGEAADQTYLGLF
jgi:hypothetical protein